MRVARWLSAPLTVLLLAVPLAVAVAAVSRLGTTPAVLAPEPEPVYGEVTERSFDDRQEAFLQVSFDDQVKLVSSGATGRITDVAAAPGQTITSGDVLYEVDGRSVMAFRTDGPFHRDLTTGSKGEDVAALNAMLQDLDLLGPDRDVTSFGPSMRLAVVEFNQLLGETGRDATFRSSSVVWLPAETLIVTEVSIESGAFSAGGGEALLTGVSPTSVVTLVTTDGTPLDVDRPIGIETLDGRQIGQATTADLERELAQDVINRVVTGDLETRAPAGSGGGGESAEAAGGTATPGVVRIPVLTRATEAEQRATVPVGAVIEDAEGRQCLFVDETWTPFATTVIDGGIGHVVIAEAPEVGRLVLANPITMGRKSCSS